MNNTHKIGFCFMIKSQLHNQNVWKAYLSNIPTHKYKIYIHYKQKCPVILENYEFIDSIPTKWADISLVEASLLLFERAYKDGCDTMFLLSGDTLPLQPYKIIDQINTTIFHVPPIHSSKKWYNAKQYNKLSDDMKLKMPLSNWEKQNMFFCITRRDYIKIRNHNQTTGYKKLHAPDEFYFINLFKLLKLNYTQMNNYIFVNRNRYKTGSIRITNRVFYQYFDTIKTHYFIRKISDSKNVPIYVRHFKQNILKN